MRLTPSIRTLQQPSKIEENRRPFRGLIWNSRQSAMTDDLTTAIQYHQLGRPEQAVELIGRAIAVNPGVAAFHANLAEAYRALGQPERAAGCCQLALRLQPHYPEAVNNLGLAWLAQGKAEA